MKSLLFSILVTLLIPLPEAFSQTYELKHDGFDNLAHMERKVRDIEEVNRIPLFDNAPFLRLRKGDKLVKAKQQIEPFSKPSAEPEKVYYFLFSGGKYFQLWTQEENGKLLLSPAFHAAEYCLFFDWDLTMPNAKALRELLPSEYTTQFSNDQFEMILNSVRKEFPEAIPPSRINSERKKDRIISIPGHMLAEFQGLAFDYHRNCIYRYSIRISPQVFLIYGQTLLQGPQHVELDEFEPQNYDGVPNAPLPNKVDPATAKIKKAEYEKMVRFRKLVEDTIRPQARAR